MKALRYKILSGCIGILIGAVAHAQVRPDGPLNCHPSCLRKYRECTAISNMDSEYVPIQDLSEFVNSQSASEDDVRKLRTFVMGESKLGDAKLAKRLPSGEPQAGTAPKMIFAYGQERISIDVQALGSKCKDDYRKCRKEKCKK